MVAVGSLRVAGVVEMMVVVGSLQVYRGREQSVEIVRVCRRSLVVPAATWSAGSARKLHKLRRKGSWRPRGDFVSGGVIGEGKRPLMRLLNLCLITLVIGHRNLSASWANASDTPLPLVVPIAR